MGKSETVRSSNSAASKMMILDTVWSEPSSPLIDNNSFFDSLHDPDELFLLPDSVLASDSFTFREDVNSIAPNFFLTCDSPTSRSLLEENPTASSSENRSLRLLEDIEGYRLARASDGCGTLWLCDATSEAPTHGPESSQPPPPPSLLNSSPDKSMQRSTESLSSKKSFSQRSRSECNREREERVKRIREQQETDRRRKLEELKQHALSAQKFRQQQELERRRHIEELRLRDSDKRHQVEERKRVLEEVERDRRVALLRKNKEREERIEQKRRAQNQMNFAFGSSTPRMIEPRVDSMSDLWGGTRSRSTSSSNVFAQMSQSMYCNRRSAEREPSSDAKKQRATSAHGLDRNDGEDLMSQSCSGVIATPTAHRRRTDLVPTITMSSSRTSRRCKSPGLSRENSLHPSRPPSGMSTDSRNSAASTGGGGVRMRSTPSRRPRPISIATTGVMSSSLHLENKKPPMNPSPLAARNRQKSTSSLSGVDLRKKRARSVTSDREEDTKSTASNSSSVMSKSMTSRRTPAQVKADSAARKAKVSATPKSSSGPRRGMGSKSPSLSGSTKSLEDDGSPPEDLKSPGDGGHSSSSSSQESPLDLGATPGRKLITSEEEAKARLAEKRREMKEKKEREAEAERARLAEEERLERERLAQEEEEERLAMEEAERLAGEARKAEEERLQKAIQEAELRREEERKKAEEEERARKEKEEQERKKQEELSEKLRKEEEERMLRKKRIEEIMSRTRKNNNSQSNDGNKSTPDSAKTSPQEEEKNGGEVGGSSQSVPIKDITQALASTTISSSTVNHSSGEDGSPPLDDNVNNVNNNSNHSDKLSNHIHHSHEENSDSNDNFVQEENAKNVSLKNNNSSDILPSKKPVSETKFSEMQADMEQNGDISSHPEGDDSSSDTRQDLDQIMELSVEPNKESQFSAPSSPLIAFEESINVPKQEPPTADLLS
eukprot:TRINITY_DN816_c0_g1_i1.p1 TRINITY_DN816_c0_g1~~TRINITY_DN816_c0_g1_i1.p1  ORF type:complete len:950 (-),score=305.00 TRINITY_DN816_c0_g1_i1:1183-4032(-)